MLSADDKIVYTDSIEGRYMARFDALPKEWREYLTTDEGDQLPLSFAELAVENNEKPPQIKT